MADVCFSTTNGASPQFAQVLVWIWLPASLLPQRFGAAVMPGQPGKHQMRQHDEQRDPLLEGDSLESFEQTAGLKPAPKSRNEDDQGPNARENPEQRGQRAESRLRPAQPPFAFDPASAFDDLRTGIDLPSLVHRFTGRLCGP